VESRRRPTRFFGATGLRKRLNLHRVTFFCLTPCRVFRVMEHETSEGTIEIPLPKPGARVVEQLLLQRVGLRTRTRDWRTGAR
jgi:hypothetical protein